MILSLFLEFLRPNEVQQMYKTGSEQFSGELNQYYFTNGTVDTTIIMNIHKHFPGISLLNLVYGRPCSALVAFVIMTPERSFGDQPISLGTVDSR